MKYHVVYRYKYLDTVCLGLALATFCAACIFDASILAQNPISREDVIERTGFL